MAEQDVNQKLGELTNRQREILKLFCEGLKYKDIAEKLFLGENTVKTHMANIYVKLGIDHLPSTLRHKILFDTYCPALHEMEFPSKKDERIEPEPASEEIIQMVEEDEKAIIPYEPKFITKPPIEPKKRNRHYWRWILLLFLLVLLVFGGVKVYEGLSGLLRGIQASPVPTQPSQVLAQSVPTEIPKPVITMVAPTNTAIIATPTSPPLSTNTFAPTKVPSPKISLPFMDNFSNGINSPWTVGHGNWFVTNSGASISISDLNDDTGSIVLDDPTLTDYKVSVKVHTPHMWSANQGQFGVIVRYGSNRDQNIIFYMDSNGRFKWSYINSLSELSFYQPAITGVDKNAGNTDVTLEIEVIGNTFIGMVNGGKIDQFSMSGYENGGIVLMTACGNVGSCPSFSDLSIEPAN